MNLPEITVGFDHKKNLLVLKNTAIYKINSDEYKIEAGFKYDGASIPKVFWSLISGKFHPDFQLAALLHDYMYIKSLGRDKADEYFHKLLLNRGVKKLKAKLMYLAVHWFGNKAYIKYREG